MTTFKVLELQESGFQMDNEKSKLTAELSSINDKVSVSKRPWTKSESRNPGVARDAAMAAT